jgi:arsenate reductase
MIIMPLFPVIEQLIKSVLKEEDLIPSERKKELLRLANYIHQQQTQNQIAQLNFICTHNSRRSHLAQIWTAVAAYYFGVDKLKTYSGGTEATAFNERAVTALKRIGFKISDDGGKNPRYQLQFAEATPGLVCWSKVYNAPSNPKQDFAAIMTCSDADDNCPIIPGAAFRLALTYEDPKIADGTPEESQRYDERVRQIGREICWMMKQLAIGLRSDGQ